MDGTLIRALSRTTREPAASTISVPLLDSGITVTTVYALKPRFIPTFPKSPTHSSSKTHSPGHLTSPGRPGATTQTQSHSTVKHTGPSTQGASLPKIPSAPLSSGATSSPETHIAVATSTIINAPEPSTISIPNQSIPMVGHTSNEQSRGILETTGIFGPPAGTGTAVSTSTSSAFEVTTTQKSVTIGTIVGTVVGVSALCCVIALCITFFRRRHRVAEGTSDSPVGSHIETKPFAMPTIFGRLSPRAYHSDDDVREGGIELSEIEHDISYVPVTKEVHWQTLRIPSDFEPAYYHRRSQSTVSSGYSTNGGFSPDTPPGTRSSFSQGREDQVIGMHDDKVVESHEATFPRMEETYS